MNDLYHVSIIRARRGNFSTVFTFVHYDEGQANSLAGEIASRLFDDTGASHMYHVEPIPHVADKEGERAVWHAAINA